MRECFCDEARFYPRPRGQQVQKPCDMLEEPRKAVGAGTPARRGKYGSDTGREVRRDLTHRALMGILRIFIFFPEPQKDLS